MVLQPSNLGLHELDHAANPERFLSNYCGDEPLDVIYIEGMDRVRVLSGKLSEGHSRESEFLDSIASELTQMKGKYSSQIVENVNILDKEAI